MQKAGVATLLMKSKIKREEAIEAIQTVIAKYSQSPEFSGFRKQVGAVISSKSMGEKVRGHFGWHTQR